MRTATETLDQTFLEMRWRALSLAADMDRIERATDGHTTLNDDPRVRDLRSAVTIALGAESNRAERVQMLFSDTASPPG